MTQEVKIIFGISLATVVILMGGVFFLNKSGQSKADSILIDSSILTRNKNHKITSDTAKITIVEFADFQCPACARTYPVIKQILEEYKGKVTFINRHFPLPQHKNAILAAKAAEAAGGQGKFWEMHNKLYENQTQWSESNNPLEIFMTYAKELELDTEKFKQAVESNTYDSVIQEDKNDGVRLGVNFTPTLFISNKKIEVELTYQNLKAIIEVEMKQ